MKHVCVDFRTESLKGPSTKGAALEKGKSEMVSFKVFLALIRAAWDHPSSQLFWLFGKCSETLCNAEHQNTMLLQCSWTSLCQELCRRAGEDLLHQSYFAMTLMESLLWGCGGPNKALQWSKYQIGARIWPLAWIWHPQKSLFILRAGRQAPLARQLCQTEQLSLRPLLHAA